MSTTCIEQMEMHSNIVVFILVLTSPAASAFLTAKNMPGMYPHVKWKFELKMLLIVYITNLPFHVSHQDQ